MAGKSTSCCFRHRCRWEENEHRFHPEYGYDSTWNWTDVGGGGDAGRLDDGRSRVSTKVEQNDN